MTIYHPILFASRLKLIRHARRSLSDAVTKTQDAVKKGEENAYQLTEIDPPSEDPEVTRERCFQQFTKLQCSTPIYTIEQAAEYDISDGFRIYWRYPKLARQKNDFYYVNRSWRNEDTLISHFPDLTDYLVVGGGLIGSAFAYYTKKITQRAADVLVIDKEPYSSNNCTAICNGLLSCQSKSEDIVRLTAFSKELIRDLKNDVVVTPEDIAQIEYQPCTHLILWPQHEVDEVMKAVDMQIENGCYTEAKLPHELELTFPWIKAQGTDIALGTHGNQDEAIVDPIGLRNLYRTLAQAHGANLIKGEVIDFNTIHSKDGPFIDQGSAGGVVVRIPATGELRNLGFAKIILSLGHNTPYLEARSELEDYIRDQIEDLHFIRPTLRLCFSFHSFAAPVVNFPVITDTDGSVLIRKAYCGDFRYYLTYEESEKFANLSQVQFTDTTSEDPYVNLIHKSKVFEDYFEEQIKPKLVNRIPVLEDAKFNLAYSGFESYNPHDGCPVLGPHPFHSKVIVNRGYGSRLMSYAPIVAASFMELALGDEEETLDLTSHYWNRVIKHRRIDEFKCLVN